jgi:hypothetical protein
MAEVEELAIEFYRPGSAEDLAACLIALLTNAEKQQTMAVQNFSTALRQTMPTIVQKYLRHFELDQRTEVLRRVTRFRRLPAWAPSKGLLLRLMTRNSPGWVHRSGIHRPSGNGYDTRPLLNSDVNGGRKLSGIGIAFDGNGVGGSRHRNALSADARGTTLTASAGDSHDSDAEQSNDGERPTPAPALSITDESEPGYAAEGQQPRGRK